MRFEAIRRALASKLWFIHEAKMQEILGFLEFRLAGGHAAEDVLADIRAANEISAARARNVAAAASGSVAVIPVYGLIMHRGGMSDLSGPSGTSCEQIAQQLRAAAGDPNVKAIVLDIDSPGGDTDGVDELAAEIYSTRKQKKITAVSNSLCSSAAYYLAAQASEVVASPSSLTGSIGVYMLHEDASEYYQKAGVKFDLIKFGENKASVNDFQPLTDAARAHLQEIVDTFGAMFEKAVARGRGIKQDDVHRRFGQGRVFDAKRAVQLGLADRVATLDEVLQGYGVTRTGGSAAASASATVQASEAPKADPADGDGPDCTCACESCQAGDCSACTHEACMCDGCMCDSATGGRQKAHAANQRRLQLATL